jgi:hypothetical protein
MMKKLQLEGRFNEKGFSTKRKEIGRMRFTWFYISWGF